MAAKTVQIGDTTYTIGKFSTYKALRAAAMVTAILKAVPSLSKEMTEFAAEYREKNQLRISRAAAELRYPPEELAKVSEAGWEASGGELVMPAAPGPMEMAAFVFPRVFDETRERVLTLLALIAVPNSKLRDADGDGTVDQVLAEEVQRLEHTDLDELVDLMAVAAEVIEEQFAGKAEKVRKAAGLFGFQMPGLPTENGSEPTTEGTTTPTPSKPDTSTDSDAPTAGPETTLSTEPTTDSPAPS